MTFQFSWEWAIFQLRKRSKAQCKTTGNMFTILQVLPLVAGNGRKRANNQSHVFTCGRFFLHGSKCFENKKQQLWFHSRGKFRIMLRRMFVQYFVYKTLCWWMKGTVYVYRSYTFLPNNQGKQYCLN